MTRVFPALVLAASALAGATLVTAQGQPGGRGIARDPRQAQQQTAGTAVIRGRIRTADTGAPIRRAQVRAVAGDIRGSRLATTDGEGRFEFRDLPAGRWQISASKAGFVTLRYGQRRPFEAGRPIELGDNQTISNADIALPRGAAITGRVYDEFGDAVAGARLQVMRYQMIEGTRRLTPTGIGDQSDDTGAFRLYGLTPGDYYVSAAVRALPVDDPSADAAGYAPTYYPGTGNIAEAQRLTVTVGQELTNISFALQPVRTVRVSGHVIDSQGKPLGGGFLSLLPADSSSDAPIFFGGGGGVRGDGTFTLTNVSPGSYTLMVVSGAPFGRGFGGFGGRGGAFNSADAGEIASMSLSVGTEDLKDLYVVTGKGATLSGTVVAAPGATSTPPLSNIQISTQPVPFSRGLPARQAGVDANGAFTLGGLVGSRVLRVSGLPQTWMVDAIVLNGSDITDRPLEFTASQEVRNVRIQLTDKVTQLSGTVMSGNQAAKDYTVVVFPDDNDKWAFPSRYVRSGRPDQDGTFKIGALPPDDKYLAVAVDYLEDGEASDPQFLEQMRDRATKFGIGAGEAKSLELKLIER